MNIIKINYIDATSDIASTYQAEWDFLPEIAPL